MTPPIQFTNMSDFLKASPFDSSYDLYPTTLTPDVFYEHLHVKSDDATKLLGKFHDSMFSPSEPDRVIFLKGFAGNGKTTFLHTFRREHSKYRHVYCDFQELRTTDLASSPEEKDNPDEVKLLMNRYLRALPNIDETFAFVDENRAALKDDDFISFRLYQHLISRPTGARTDPLYIRRWMDRFDFKDIFTCLFVHLFREGLPGQKTIVYFDNLDIPRMEYVADRFLVYFQDALNCAGHASRHSLFAGSAVDFRNAYRFVICLREVNEAILNAHLGDRLGFARTSFPLAFDAKSFTEIATRRIEYLERYAPVQNQTPYKGGRWSSIFRAVLADDNFRNVFLPLYNYNYRELSGTLVNVIEKNRITERDIRYSHRLRGILMFGIVKRLVEQDFLAVYHKTRNDTRIGYCFIDRVLLTVLINASNYRRRVDAESDDSDPYGLLFLVKDLQPLYDVGSILTSIARCFLSHRLSRIHLLTVLNTKIDDPEEFVRQLATYIESAEQGDDPVAVRARNDVRSILLKVNPAGFTCVRYILPHFEFYSSLVRNEESLFRNPMSQILAEKGEIFAFEPKVDKVLALVEEHVMSMKKFFDRKYTTIRKMNVESFPRSKYCFRHPGDSRVARPTGHSHTIKVLTAHIGYLDLFRYDLINRPGAESLVPKINEALVSRIRSYVKLFSHALDRGPALSFADQFERPIAIIEQSGHSDRTTRIELERFS